jgi:O-antigen/teichoic acid export membrane protein
MIISEKKAKWMYMFFMTTASLMAFSKFLIFSKILSIQDFGIYSLVLSLYIFYVFIGGIGLQEGLLKKGSMSFAIQDHNSSKVFLASSIIASITISGIVAVIIISVAYINLDILGTNIQIFFLGFLLAVATVLFGLLDSFLRSQQKFVLYSGILMLKNLSAIIVGISLASNYGVQGLIFSEFISVLCIFIVTLIHVFKIRNFALAKAKVAIKLIRHGYKVMLTMVVRNIALMADRWFIVLAVGVTALGYYSFAMILYTISLVSVGFLVTMKGPVWIAAFKTNNNAKDLINNINKWVWLIWLILILFSPVIWFFTDDVLSFLYPQYANETVYSLTYIIYASLMAVIPIYLYDWAFIATSKEGILFNLNIFGLILSTLFYSVAWFLSSSILVFALLFFAARAIMLCVFLYHLRVMYVS